MRAVFFGMGYSSLAAARAMRAQGFDAIAGTSRTADGARRIDEAGFEGHVFDGEARSDSLVPAIRAATAMVFSIAPDDAGDPALRLHGRDIDAAERLEWLCYYSTIGVYGDRQGDWVDETGETDATNARSQRRVDTERQFRAYAEARGVPLMILRLGGIYGPGRSTFDKLRDGTAKRVVKPGQVFNRIHVEDIGRVTALAAERRLAGTFNLVDDEPAPPQDLVVHAAAMMGVTPPPEVSFEDAQFNPMQRSFYADNKRVSNRAIKQALGIELKYPTYREGLASIGR